MKALIVVLASVLAVGAGFVVALAARGGSSARVAATSVSLPSPPLVSPAPTVAGHSRAGAAAKNRVFVATMFSDQAAWPVGYELSYSPVVSRFDNLVVTLNQGVQSWTVVHLVFRWTGSRWVEVANIPATLLGDGVPNGQLERFQPFAS